MPLYICFAAYPTTTLNTLIDLLVNPRPVYAYAGLFLFYLYQEAAIQRLFPHLWIDARGERAAAQEYVARLRIQTPSLSQLVQFLSGGNQQNVVLGKWLATHAKLFILDEPTRGIDVGAKLEIHRLMDELVAQGTPMVMISSEMPEILGMSDRIYVMREGRMVGEFAHHEASQERILTCAVGG